MTTARSDLVDLDVTPYSRCSIRTVRGASLCGEDRDTGDSFDQREVWIVGRLELFAASPSVDVFAYVVMPYHLHVACAAPVVFET